jgi:predicted acylesterase/phospholipase RssA
MDFHYIPPRDFEINHEPLKALIKRHEFAATELGQEFLKENAFPDKKTIALIRPPGCRRGIRNSGVWLSLDDYMHHDVDVGVSVGTVEQVNIGQPFEAVGLYWLENFIRLHNDDERDVLNFMRIVKYEIGRRTPLSATAPIHMPQLRKAMDALWSDEFTRHRAQKIAIVTNALTGEPIEFDLDHEFRTGGKDRVLDIVMASAHMPGVAGPFPVLEVDGKKIPVCDGFFNGNQKDERGRGTPNGPVPFDAALRRGATDIILPLSLPDHEIPRLSARQRQMFMYFLKQKNPKADVAHENGIVRNELYFSQIRKNGEIKDEEGRTARVMMIPLSVGEEAISATETRRDVLEATLERGKITGLAVKETALKSLAAERPAKVRVEAPGAGKKTLIAA